MLLGRVSLLTQKQHSGCNSPRALGNMVTARHLRYLCPSLQLLSAEGFPKSRFVCLQPVRDFFPMNLTDIPLVHSSRLHPYSGCHLFWQNRASASSALQAPSQGTKRYRQTYCLHTSAAILAKARGTHGACYIPMVNTFCSGGSNFMMVSFKQCIRGVFSLPTTTEASRWLNPSPLCPKLPVAALRTFVTSKATSGRDVPVLLQSRSSPLVLPTDLPCREGGNAASASHRPQPSPRGRGCWRRSYARFLF